MPDESDELIAELKTFGAEMVNVGDRYKKIQAAIANKRRGKYTAEGLRAQENFDLAFGQQWDRAIGQLLADVGFAMVGNAQVARGVTPTAGVVAQDQATQFVNRWTAEMQQGFAVAQR